MRTCSTPPTRRCGSTSTASRRSRTTCTGCTRTTRASCIPLPINLGTINQFFGAAYSPGRGARRSSTSSRASSTSKDAANLEEKGIALIGRPLYEAFIRDYTAKQWQTDPKNLPAEVISRLPVRYNYDNRYFNDTWEGLPTDGYTAWIERMADHPNIEVKLDVDFFDETQPLQQGGDRRPAADRLHRPDRPLLRRRRGRAVVAHARLRAGGPAASATSRAHRS